MLKQTIWQWLILALQQQKAVALLWVVDNKGSSPAKTGAKMAVSKDGSFGTIGGGQLEYNLSQYAQKSLNKIKQPIQLIHKKHYGSDVQASGQICGGQQTIVQILLQQTDLPLLQEIQQAQQQSQPIVLKVSPQSLKISSLMKNISIPEFHYNQQLDWYYQSIIGSPKQAYIIGGGHVSLALTQVLVLLDFKVTIIEQRAAVKTMQQNVLADHKQIISYTKLADEISDVGRVYLFVMTHSHETDQQVVKLLANKDFSYFGILGSRRKIKKMRKNLASYVSEKRWQSIHAPIGLVINSHSPMEIAISIGAELIQVDNG